jgi:hypothetical protein
MHVSAKNRDILRTLGAQVSQIAAMPVQQETRSLWKALNGLRPVRPMVMIDQIPWHEMDVDGELTLQTDDNFCRRIETGLRRTLYRWKHMRADMVVEPELAFDKVICSTGYGLENQEERAVIDPRNDVVGHLYLNQIQTEADIEKIQTPRITFDAAATADVEQTAHEIFDGILPVRMQGSTWHCFCPWDKIVQWRSVNDTLYDLADRPEFLHKLMARLTDAILGELDQLEAQGLLDRQSTIHCTGGWTDELPAPGHDPCHLRARDIWTCGMAQIFASVSSAMHQEFELDYAHRWYSRFGLVYYGCCEPLDDKMDIVRKIPHLRKVSMSPWVNVEKGAQKIGRDFVFSRKPSPALLATDTFDPSAVEKDLRETAAACAAHGCPLEFILKDISTVRYEPKRLWEWAAIARRVACG